MASFVATTLLGTIGLGVKRHQFKKQKADGKARGDPRTAGPVYARNRTADVPHIGLNKPVQNTNRAPPPEVAKIKMRQPLTLEAARRVQVRTRI